VKLPAGWRDAIDSLCHDLKPFQASCFRSVELAWAHPDDVISGEGTKVKGGRFAPKGMRAVYASLDEETTTREVSARKARLGGKAQIALKDYPRVVYIVSVEAKRCLDLRDAGNDSISRDVLKAALVPDDLSASQELGDFLSTKGVDAIIFPSVVGHGTNIAVFLDVDPPPRIEITNRNDIMEAIAALAKRSTY